MTWLKILWQEDMSLVEVASVHEELASLDGRSAADVNALSFRDLLDCVPLIFPELKDSELLFYYIDANNDQVHITNDFVLKNAFRRVRKLAEKAGDNVDDAECKIIVVAKQASASLAMNASSSSTANVPPSDSSAEHQRLKETLASMMHEESEKAVMKRLQDFIESTPSKRPRSENVESLDSVPQIDIENCRKYSTDCGKYLADYWMLPKSLMEKCGLFAEDDVKLYCRPQVRELWTFLENNMIKDNSKPLIVGPPGTGKSACVLSFVASLDRQEWNVVWVHLEKGLPSSCLVMGSKKYWRFSDRSEFVVPHVPGKKLFLCVDGCKRTDADDLLMARIHLDLGKDDRLVICSSMTTAGKRNEEDDDNAKIKQFLMYSWTQDEYLEAISDLQFYEKIRAKLDATSANEVNDDGGDEDLSEEDKKTYALNLKFYYAGGSCRFMFQLSTKEVKRALVKGVKTTPNMAALITYCNGDYHSESVNKLYGMQGNDSMDGERFPVSSFVASLFAEKCDETTIARLADHLNASSNPALDGHIFEWLFLAAVPKREVKLFADQDEFDTLPQANVLRFNPKKRFKTLVRASTTRYNGEITACHDNGTYDIYYADRKKNSKVAARRIELRDKSLCSGEEHNSEQLTFNVGDKVSVLPNSTIISGNKSWLQPVAWNQGGYDAVHFDVYAEKVIFVQVTRSNKHSFKMFYFNEVLLRLKWAGMTIGRVEVYFVVKPSQTLDFSLSMVEDRGLLEKFDRRWEGCEEDKVKVRAFGEAFKLID